MFRAALILFASEARPALEEVSSEVMRLRLWLENDQWRHWENELRLRNKKLEQAQQELLTLRLSDFSETTTLQQMSVRRARQAVEQSQEKLKALKRWDRDLENRVAPFLKEVDQLHSFLVGEMPKALAYLAQVVRTLDAYASTGAGAGRAVPTEGKKA